MYLKQVLQGVERKENMAVEENLKISLYKIEVYLLKVIPIVLALGDLLNTLLYLFDIDAAIISYIGGVSFITLLFLYLSSYVFRFCEYHRIPLHFIVVNNIINIYDWYIGIPLGLVEMILIEVLLVGITIFLIIYLHEKNHKKLTSKPDR